MYSSESFWDGRELRMVEGNPVRKNNWVLTALLLLMDCIGTGVLTIPYAFKRLGWLPAIFGMISLCFIARYTGGLLFEQALKYPNTSNTLGRLAEHYFNNWGAKLVRHSLYVIIFIVIAYYQLVISKAIQDMLYKTPICLYHAGLIGGAIQLPLIQLRTLHDISRVLSCISLVTILIVLIMCVAAAGRNGSVGETAAFNIDSIFGLMGSTTTILFSYSGHGIYLEMISEMKNPRDFVQSLNASYALMAIIYMSVGILTYYFSKDGVPGYLLDVIPPGKIKAIASGLLLIHVLSICVLRYQVVTRAIHSWLHPGSVDAFDMDNENYWCGKGIWILLSIVLWLVGYISANSIPFFVDFVELVSSLGDPWLVIGAPCVFHWLHIKSNIEPISWGKRFRMSVLVVLCTAVLLFGTGDALKDSIKKRANIWACTPDDNR